MSDWESVSSQVRQLMLEIGTSANAEEREGRELSPLPAEIEEAERVAVSCYGFISDLRDVIQKNNLSDDVFDQTLASITVPLPEMEVMRNKIERFYASGGILLPDITDSLKVSNVEAGAYVEKLLRSLEEVIPRFPQPPIRMALWRIADGTKSRLYRENLLEDIGQARDEVVAARDAAREAARITSDAAGEVGSRHQADYYEKFADVEAAAANQLRVYTSAILLSLAIGALVFSLTTSVDNFAWAEALKLAIALPLAVLAAYLGRESGRHRTNSNWSRELAMQLRTFDAFTEPLEPVDKNDARKKFASLLFVKVERNSPERESGPSVTNEAVKLIEAVSKATPSANKGDKEKRSSEKTGGAA